MNIDEAIKAIQTAPYTERRVGAALDATVVETCDVSQEVLDALVAHMNTLVSDDALKEFLRRLNSEIKRGVMRYVNTLLNKNPDFVNRICLLGHGVREKKRLCALYGQNAKALQFINDMTSACHGTPPVIEQQGCATHLVVTCHKRDLVTLIRATDVPLIVARDGNHYKLSVVAEITKASGSTQMPTEVPEPSLIVAIELERIAQEIRRGLHDKLDLLGEITNLQQTLASQLDSEETKTLITRVDAARVRKKK